MDTKNILVAGATGTNGRELIRQLTEKGLGVRALVRSVTKAADLASDLVELIEGDLSDRASLEPAFDGIEKAYVVTAVHRDSVAWFDNFFTAAKSGNVGHVIKLSGLGAGTDSPSALIRQHGESDELLKASGLTYTILRPNSFFQNMLWQAQSIAATGMFYLPFGNARQSVIDVRDIAAATVRILTEAGHENKAYELTGPESLSDFDIAATLAEVIERSVTYVPVSLDDARSAMLDSGMPEWDAHAVAELQGVFATGRYADVTPDLEGILGKKPRTFEDFARDHSDIFAGPPVS